MPFKRQNHIMQRHARRLQYVVAFFAAMGPRPDIQSQHMFFAGICSRRPIAFRRCPKRQKRKLLSRWHLVINARTTERGCDGSR